VQVGFVRGLGIAGRDEKTDSSSHRADEKLERTMDVVTRLRAEIHRLNTDGSLPPGVQVDAF